MNCKEFNNGGRTAYRFRAALTALAVAAGVMYGYVPLHAGVAIESGVSASGITMAGTVAYTVTVSWNADEGEYVFTWPEPPRSTLLEVTGTAASSGRTVDNGRTRAVRTFTYTLTPLKTGTAVIEPSAVTYRGPDGSGATLHTRAARVDIAAAPGAFPRGAVVWTLAAMLAAGGGGAAFIFMKRRGAGRNAPADGTGVPARSPREAAEETVKGLEHLIMEGEPKEYCAGLVRAARSYVEARYLLAFGNKLSADVVTAATDADVPGEAVDALKRILDAGDTLRFSTAEPSGEQLKRLKSHMHELLRTDLT